MENLAKQQIRILKNIRPFFPFELTEEDHIKKFQRILDAMITGYLLLKPEEYKQNTENWQKRKEIVETHPNNLKIVIQAMHDKKHFFIVWVTPYQGETLTWLHRDDMYVEKQKWYNRFLGRYKDIPTLTEILLEILKVDSWGI